MPRLNGNTKQIIQEEALKLFSERGFEAVSIRTIADAVGIGNSALYKHYSSKQAIFDAIVESSKEKFLEQSNLVTADIRGVEAVMQTCLSMFEYQTKNEWVVRFRQMLLLEKFHNPQMAAIYKEFFVDIPIKGQIEIFECLQKQHLMIEGNPRVYAMELYAPFYLYHFVEHDYDELKILLKQHAENFFKEHFKNETMVTE